MDCGSMEIVGQVARLSVRHAAIRGQAHHSPFNRLSFDYFAASCVLTVNKIRVSQRTTSSGPSWSELNRCAVLVCDWS